MPRKPLKVRERRAIPREVRALFMIGMGWNGYKADKISALWKKYGQRFIDSLPPKDQRAPGFQSTPFICAFLGREI